MLKDAGASEDVLQVARLFECEVCRRHGRKSSVRPSAVPHVTEVWDTISIDTFWWSSPHLDENGKPLNHCVGLSILDEASDYHVCCVIRQGTNPQPSISADEFKQAFLSNWCRHLPVPKNLRYDAEGFLRSLSLIQWLESQGIHLQAISGEAPWQLGKHSRHLETVKANLTLLASVTCEELLDLTVSTKNEMHSVRGFSPNQWSFGQGKGRVESFLQNGDILPTQSVRDIPVLKKISNAETMHGWFFSKKTLGNVLTEPLFTVLVRIKNLNLANLSISFDEVEVMVVGMRVFGSVRLELCVLKRLEMIA